MSKIKDRSFLQFPLLSSFKGGEGVGRCKRKGWFVNNKKLKMQNDKVNITPALKGDFQSMIYKTKPPLVPIAIGRGVKKE